MKVGVFTVVLGQLPLERVLAKLKGLRIDTVELGTGNYPGGPHCPLTMLDNAGGAGGVPEKAGRQRLPHQRAQFARQSAAPRRGRREATQRTSRKTILLAEKLGVPVVVDFSGCPGDSRRRQISQLGHLPMAARVSGHSGSGSGRRR